MAHQVNIILVLAAACAGCEADATEAELLARASAFEQASGVQRVDCSLRPGWAKCSGVLKGRPVTYYCKKLAAAPACQWLMTKCEE